MTAIYTVDVCEYQPNAAALVPLLKAQGYLGLMARCVIGSYVDPEYAAFLAAAKAAKMLFSAYWYPHTAVPLATSLDLLAAHIIDKSVPVGLIDWEADGSSVPSYDLMVSAQSGMRARGLVANTIYTYGGYWSGHGSPVMSTAFKNLIGADYAGNPAGYGSVIYPGDTSSRWNGYGGFARKTGLQFGSNIMLDNYPNRLDGDAWTLTRAQLVAAGLFKDFAVTAPVPPTPPNPAHLTKPTIYIASRLTDSRWLGSRRAVVEWAAVPGATWYMLLGSLAPIHVPAVPGKVTALVAPGGYHVRAYCDGSTSDASNAVTV